MGAPASRKPAWVTHLSPGTVGEDRRPVCGMQWNLARIVTRSLSGATCRRCLAEVARNLSDPDYPICWNWVQP